MLFKYQAQINALHLTSIDCVCQVAQPRMQLAYRIASNPAADPSNFIPRPLMPGVPARALAIPCDNPYKSQREADEDNLNAWGISLHENPDAARSLANRYKRAFTFATHIAELNISPADGLCSTTDDHYHFNIHEELTANLGARVIKALPR
ncbi:hypothetical protein [Hymenobacter canadensis]|uniref:Uncharacterized protein n=1 Tax=Hymenobacter canadensis TaxID=2999067 RepID=A0ABY7LRB1_9BACT|nr:hypothetical protein [Hymenobacter canadensis]WBA42949.1 hypothetical protein O3303_05145 [Hymenobacter canadensis]